MSSNGRGAEAPRDPAAGESTAVDLFSRVLHEPGNALAVAHAIFKGWCYSWWVKCFRPRIVIGRGLRIYGTLRIRGPGMVVFGDEVQIYGTVTPWTNRATARILVGDRTKLDGTRFSCVQLIEIGSDCLIANCRILDTSFHATSRRAAASDARVLEAPVAIGSNVWIAPDAGLLPGTRIGEGSVVAMAAICKGEYPSDVMILGNPARVAGRLT